MALRHGESLELCGELEFLRGVACSEESIRERLERGGVIGHLAKCLATSLEELQAGHAATAEELHDKFVADGNCFKLQLGGRENFDDGLEGIVGRPIQGLDKSLEKGIRKDHCYEEDSKLPFDMPNKKAQTTSEIEWRFVCCPEDGADGKGPAPYNPVHGPELTPYGYPMPATPFVPYPKPDASREPWTLEHFEAELAKRNQQLAKHKTTLSRDEFIGARLYTSPMYLKYNAVLRGEQFRDNAKFAQEYAQLCRGNRYATTLHAINEAIIKLSTLTKVTSVYRGVWGGVLPDVCRAADEYGVRGGIEGGFMSCTTDKRTAFYYAIGGADKSKRSAGPAIVFESRQTGVGRGANIAWLSEFPEEEEILFAPLTAIDVQGSRVEGAVQVYEINVTVNMKSSLKQREQMLGLLADPNLINDDDSLRIAVNRAHRYGTTPADVVPKNLARLRDAGASVAARHAAVRTLGGLDPVVLSPHIAAIHEHLTDADWGVLRGEAQQVVEQAEATASGAAAVIARLEYPDRFVRMRAEKKLRHLEPGLLAQNATALVAMLQNADSGVRRAAVATLGELPPPVLAQHAAAVVDRPLKDDSELVRWAAVQTLGKLEPAELVMHASALAARRAADPSEDVRQAVVEMLGKLMTHHRDDPRVRGALQGVVLI